MGFERGGEFVAIHYRHREIGDDEIEFGGVEQSESLFGVAGAVHLVPINLQQKGYRLADQRFIIDNHNMPLSNGAHTQCGYLARSRPSILPIIACWSPRCALLETRLTKLANHLGIASDALRKISSPETLQ